MSGRDFTDHETPACAGVTVKTAIALFVPVMPAQAGIPFFVGREA